MLGPGLLVEFKAMDHATSVILAEESGFIGEIVDLDLMLAVENVMRVDQAFTMKKDKAATTIATRPSRMKIHAHPGLPPTPSIFTMAAARRPPKEPASAAAEKKMAARTPNSDRLYQHDR